MTITGLMAFIIFLINPMGSCFTTHAYLFATTPLFYLGLPGSASYFGSYLIWYLPYLVYFLTWNVLSARPLLDRLVRVTIPFLSRMHCVYRFLISIPFGLPGFTSYFGSYPIWYLSIFGISLTWIVLSARPFLISIWVRITSRSYRACIVSTSSNRGCTSLFGHTSYFGWLPNLGIFINGNLSETKVMYPSPHSTHTRDAPLSHYSRYLSLLSFASRVGAGSAVAVRASGQLPLLFSYFNYQPSAASFFPTRCVPTSPFWNREDSSLPLKDRPSHRIPLQAPNLDTAFQLEPRT